MMDAVEHRMVELSETYENGSALDEYLQWEDTDAIDQVTLMALIRMDDKQWKVADFPTGAKLVRVGNHVFEGRSEDGSVVFGHLGDVYEFLSDITNETIPEYYGDVEQKFNDDFWDYPTPLMHGTNDIEAVLREGLSPASETRGISNRSVGSAVFATTEMSIANEYGGDPDGGVVQIDTQAMKRDGYMPFVSEEPQIREYEHQTALAHGLGVEDWEPDMESGIDRETIIIHGAIPAKYLTRVQENPTSKPRVSAVIIRKNGAVLLLKRSSSSRWAPGKWNLPMGHIEPGETPVQAAVRETREESSLRVSGLTHLGDVKHKGAKGAVAYFEAKRFTGRPKIDHESSDWAWVKPGELSSYDCVPGLKRGLTKPNPVHVREGTIEAAAKKVLTGLQDTRLEKELKPNPALTVGDKRVIDAFVDKEARSGKFLDTDGKKLTTTVFGGGEVARWYAGELVVTLDPATKLDGTILRYLHKLQNAGTVKSRTKFVFSDVPDKPIRSDEVGGGSVTAKVDGEQAGKLVWYKKKLDGKYFIDSIHVRQMWRRKGVGTGIYKAWMQRLGIGLNDLALTPKTKMGGRFRKSIDKRLPNPTLTPKDKKVIGTFVKREQAYSRILLSDGRTLSRMGLGSEDVAVWMGDKIVEVSTESTTFDQTILRYLKKRAGSRNVVSGYGQPMYAKGLRFMVTGDVLHAGQWNGRILAYVPGGKLPIGYLDYIEYQGRYQIQMVEVDPAYKRHGVATALHKHLLAYHKITPADLDKSMQTEEGYAFRRAVDPYFVEDER